MKRKARWSLAWIVVCIPLTLALTVPATTPDAEYVRASIRAQKLDALLTAPASATPYLGTAAALPADIGTPYKSYFLARAAERREHAVAFPWSRWLSTSALLLLCMGIVPAWLSVVRFDKPRGA